jgi:hypothetical protein
MVRRAGSADETLEQVLAEEHLAEMESELDQDEHPSTMRRRWKMRKKPPRSVSSSSLK